MNTPSHTFVEPRSEDVQDILTRPPKWLIQWGNVIIFIIIILFSIGSWVIHYPDIVQASFTLTSTNVPKEIISRNEGKITKILVQDGQKVKSGTILAYLESTAKHGDILNLSTHLAKIMHEISRNNFEVVKSVKFSKFNQLGELQNQFQIFEQSHIRLRAYLNNGYINKRKLMILAEIEDLKATAENLNQQLELLKRDVTLAEEDFIIQKQLFDQKVIAPLDIKREESKTLSRKLPYQQIALAIINNVTAQRAKQKEILELDNEVEDEKRNFLLTVNTLQSAVNAWKQKYILSTPVSGQIIYVGSIQENQSVSLNQDIFYVIPPNADFFGQLQISQQNAGKVKEGQEVYIRFEGYPFQEYGAVHGIITTISLIPFKDSVFLAQVKFTNGMKTTYGKNLIQKTGMTATADIITNDSRLIEKLFFQFRKVLNGR